MVHSVDDRVCEASRVDQIQVDLTILGTICQGKARANVRLESIEAEGHDL